ncbi:MAG TPA: M20/M25/M40 family metallo-hydrolase [Atribacteraceae bacterium]|nr:M20/M25/M40 family metallo-hydrolase [Atribacteraceae bacterium]
MKWTHVEIDKLVEEYRDEIIQTTRDLVCIPSENIVPSGNEKGCQEYLLKRLDGRKADIDLFTPDEVPDLDRHEGYFPGRDYQNRPNLVVRRRGAGGGKSLVFSSHVDVVSTSQDLWPEGDHPYSGKLTDGRIYGRGAFDMKGGLISTLFALKIISDQKLRLRGDLIFESVVDEENAGSNGTLACRVRGYNADAAIIPEPSMLTVCPAAKGGRYYRVALRGAGGMGFGEETLVNPVYGLATLIKGVEAYERWINTLPSMLSLYTGDENPRDVILDKVQAGDPNPGANVAVPAEAWFSIYITSLYSEAELLDRELTDFLNRQVQNDGFFAEQKPLVTPLSRYLYPYQSDVNHPLVSMLAKSARRFTGIENRVSGAHFACDGFIFHKYFNTPVYILGPRGGNAHACDEFVLADDVVNLTKVFMAVALEWCGWNE